MLSLVPYVGGKDLSGFLRREPFKWLNLVRVGRNWLSAVVAQMYFYGSSA